MTTRVFTDPRPQHFKSDGVSVNSSGKLYFREPGVGSTTLKNAYSDKELSIPLINPVILDSQGRAPEIFLSGDYNIQMTDSSNVQIWRVDNYQPLTVDSQFSDWNASLTYSVNDYVRYTDGNYYISLQSGNTGNVPPSSSAYWSQAFFITVFNSSDTYSEDDIVYYDGDLYSSLQNSNTGNTPSTNGTFWRRLGFSQYDNWSSSISYNQNDTVRYTDDNYYISLQDSNLGNTPGSNAYWSQIFQFTNWNSTQTYSLDDTIYYQGIIYTSLQNSNTGNTPDSSFDFWRRPGVSVPPISGYTGQIIKYIRSDSATVLDITGVMADSVPETVGPTGSGADEIWTALDDLPLNCVSISILVQATATRTTGASLLYSLNTVFYLPSGSLAIPGAALLDYGSSTEPSASKSVTIIDVPVTSANIFEAYYNSSNADTIDVFASLIGFSVEEA